MAMSKQRLWSIQDKVLNFILNWPRYKFWTYSRYWTLENSSSSLLEADVAWCHLNWTPNQWRIHRMSNIYSAVSVNTNHFLFNNSQQSRCTLTAGWPTAKLIRVNENNWMCHCLDVNYSKHGRPVAADELVIYQTDLILIAQPAALPQVNSHSYTLWKV